MKERKLQAYKKCDPIVQEFVECSRNRLFSVAWACRDQSRRMNQCIRAYASDDDIVEAQNEYLQKHRV